MTESERQPELNAPSAEEELRRIRGAIEASRRRRNQAAESFHAFLRSLPSPEQAPAPPRFRGGDRPEPIPRGLAAGVSTSIHEAPRPWPAGGGSSGRSRRPLRWAALGTVIAIVVWAMLVGRFRDDPPVNADARRPAAAEAPAPTASGAGGPGDRPITGSAPASAAGFQVEITTSRPVWLRIIVDGTRLMENEVPAGHRSVLAPKEAVTIRAGDAGALRVVVNGVDTGPLGRDGLPRTTTFSRPR